jgi:uncharacterized membrane protein (UPF0127 family)
MRYLIVIVFIFSIFTGCEQKTKRKPNPMIPPKYVVTHAPVFTKQGSLSFINSEGKALATIDIELADTFQKREKGLMDRTSMKEDEGMLFIFDAEERQSFWMKNTHITLDIIFVNNDMTVVHIAENCEPYSLKPIPSFEYARYVVEVIGGYTRKHQIKVGSEINFTLLK